MDETTRTEERLNPILPLALEHPNFRTVAGFSFVGQGCGFGDFHRSGKLDRTGVAVAVLEVSTQGFTDNVAGGDSLALGESNDAGFELGINESADEHFIFSALVWHVGDIHQTRAKPQAKAKQLRRSGLW
jgi:hypothetical protein